MLGAGRWTLHLVRDLAKGCTSLVSSQCYASLQSQFFYRHLKTRMKLESNHPAAGQAALTMRLTIEHHKPGVPEFCH